jgi:CheY-like chemotaxis protein
LLPPDQQARAIETIERNARAQARLLGDILDVSRIVAGKITLEPRPTTLAAVVERVIEDMRITLLEKRLDLRLARPERDTTVLGEPSRLQQVVWNLLSNAVKFTPADGRIDVSLTTDDGDVTLTVRDTGIGISRESLPHVFERFRQADASTTRAQSGLGLGLAIVRHIVEAHGGGVHAESPGRGGGSVFTVKLPLMVARTKSDDGRRHPTDGRVDDTRLPRLDGTRILVVDDEADASEVVAELLATQGAEVRRAHSAAAARALLDEWRPSLIVSDVGMPDEDGYAFIARWRTEAGDAARIPAVALTAYAGRTDKIRLLSAGFDAHVPKPLDPAELLTVLASLARSVRAS